MITTLTNDEARNRRLALFLSASGYSITLLYLFYGGTSRGKHWFRSLLPNGGALILIIFTLPLFIANTAASLLVKDNKATTGEDATKENNHHADRSAKQKKTCYNVIQTTTRRILASSRLFTIAYVIIPCVAFFLCSCQRHYLSAMATYPMKSHSNINNTDEIIQLEANDYYNYQIAAWRWKLLHHISNISAIVGLIAFSHLLVPVSKHSPLVVLLNWTPQEALVLHKYSGRLAVCSVLLHGFGHFAHAYWRWWSLFVSDYGIKADSDVVQNSNWMEKSFWRGFIPPLQCWLNKFGSSNSTELDFGLGCINDDVSCTCLDFWINFTGLFGLVALLVLLVGSLNHIRRHYYKVFYMVHIIAAPTFIIATVLHYNRAIMYMCPSLLYYASQAIPVYMESWLSRWKSKSSRIVAVSKIPCPSQQRPNGNVLSIEFEASHDAMSKFQPGSYCTLQVPSLSLVAHPFTVNIVPGHLNRLRILMRQIGPFTTKLVELLEYNRQLEAVQCIDSIEEEKKECNAESQFTSMVSLPAMHIDVYGTSPRMAQLYQHGSALIIAGGIGITPYLSMLTEIVTSRQANTPLKSVVLHWICRDAALIRYVYEQYFAAILEKSNGTDQDGLSIRIITHFTGSEDNAYCYNDGLQTVSYRLDTCDGTPVKSSTYSGSNTRTSVTFATIFCFSAAATMYIYTYLQSVEVISTRILGLLAICIISIVISTISHMASQKAEKVNFLPLSTNDTDRYGSTSYSQKSEIGYYSESSPGYEFNVKGRPSKATLFASLQEYESESIGLFLCGPSLMVKQLRAFLSKKNCEDIDVYEEIFEV